MKLDIVNCLNRDRLDYAIRMIGKNKIDYILMNSRTRFDLIGVDSPMVSYIGYEAVYSKYNEIPIAIFEGLPYGEVQFVNDVENGVEL